MLSVTPPQNQKASSLLRSEFTPRAHLRSPLPPSSFFQSVVPTPPPGPLQRCSSLRRMRGTEGKLHPPQPTPAASQSGGRTGAAMPLLLLDTVESPRPMASPMVEVDDDLMAYKFPDPQATRSEWMAVCRWLGGCGAKLRAEGFPRFAARQLFARCPGLC